MPDSEQMISSRTRARSILEVFAVSLRLGLTSFGGPIAHLGYLRDAYVVRRAWLSEEGFADLAALCQVLPGPASSQVNMSVGFARAGAWGAAAAWAGFTLPSAVALVAFAFLVGATDVLSSGWLHGIMVTAVAVVAQALWGMAGRLAPDQKRATVAVVAAVLSLLLPTALTQVLLIAAGGLIGWLLLPARNDLPGDDFPFHIPKGASVFCLSLFFLLLAGLPILRGLFPAHWLALVESFYRTGSLVFGGGHVVLPLLHREVVLPSWITEAQFMAGYGAAQAVPGPLFTFAAYLGALMSPAPNGVIGALIALAAIFFPSFLLLVGVLPFWAALRVKPAFQSVLAGINATVVGLLAAALYTPGWTGTIRNVPDFCIALSAFVLLVVWRARPWMVVGLGAAAGAAVRLLS